MDEALGDDLTLGTDLFHKAARGSLNAQRALRDGALKIAVGSHDLEAFAVAEAFARLASSWGEPADLTQLAGILFSRAEHLSPTRSYRDYVTAEAIATISRAADAGAEGASAVMARTADMGYDPEVFAAAKVIRRELDELDGKSVD